MGDFIEDFQTYTEGLPTPPQFRLWAAITALAGACEQRIWASTGLSRTYPNLYCILCGPPGCGKSTVITPVERLWRQAGLYVAPSSVTRAGLADKFMLAHKIHMTEDGEVLEFCSIQVASSELGNFIPARDTDFMSIINHVYDNPPSYDEARRTIEDAKQAKVTNPQLTILGGCTPSYLGGLLPDEAWAQGFPSRLCIVYAAIGPKVPLFQKREQRGTQGLALAERLKTIVALSGEMMWADGAVEELTTWYNDDLKPIPQHPKLEHYLPRRILNVLKLCMISSVSRGPALLIEAQDVLRAKDWLLEIEEAMPEIFKMASSQSDGQTLREVHAALWRITAETKASVPRSVVVGLLADRVQAHRVDSLVNLLLAAKAIEPQGSGYMPRPWRP